jgi:hypothetical protein
MGFKSGSGTLIGQKSRFREGFGLRKANFREFQLGSELGCAAWSKWSISSGGRGDWRNCDSFRFGALVYHWSIDPAGFGDYLAISRSSFPFALSPRQTCRFGAVFQFFVESRKAILGPKSGYAPWTKEGIWRHCDWA